MRARARARAMESRPVTLARSTLPRTKTHAYIGPRFNDRISGISVRACANRPSRKIFAQDNSGPHYRGGWPVFFSFSGATVVQVREEEREDEVGDVGSARKERERKRETEREGGTGGREGRRREIDSTCIN